MLKDCLEVFERQMEKVRIKGRGEDSLILDSYIPADGCYILVNSNEDAMHFEVAESTLIKWRNENLI